MGKIGINMKDSDSFLWGAHGLLEFLTLLDHRVQCSILHPTVFVYVVSFVQNAFAPVFSPNLASIFLVDRAKSFPWHFSSL